MKILIFGSENFPDISFKSNPKTGLTINTKNAETLNYDGLHEITWGDLIERGSNNYLKKTSPLEKRKGVWNILKEKLLQYTQTKSEKYFFEGYIEVCEEALYESGRLPINKILAMPALIPQVWVNWLHYDNKDKERASLVKKILNELIFSCISTIAGSSLKWMVHPIFQNFLILQNLDNSDLRAAWKNTLSILEKTAGYVSKAMKFGDFPIWKLTKLKKMLNFFQVMNALDRIGYLVEYPFLIKPVILTNYL